MNRIIRIPILLALLAMSVAAQNEIKVSPKSVNVYSQGATTVFLTYGNLGNYRPAETAWCGEVMPATPDLGVKCVPGTIYGTLPNRFDLSRRSGTNGYTDVVSVPASVSRKAYQAAAAGEDSRFFYVRRFISQSGGPDQFIEVAMRLTGNGAGVPFSLTDVQLGFGTSAGISASGQEPQILFIEPGQRLPQIRAEIKYTGTGRLRGRWELVRPGDPLPEPRDLLTEASLPVEERGTQQRYSQLGRFNLFLAPNGRFTLPGPDISRVPTQIAGGYLVLLRIEASDDRENDSNLGAVGAGTGIVHSGAAAGFPLPVLRYIVGGGDNTQQVATTATFNALTPRNGSDLPASQAIDFAWAAMPGADVYRLEVEDDAGKSLLAAVLKSETRSYRAPSWFKTKAGLTPLRWRVVAFDRAGNRIGETPAQSFRLIPGR
ncbi:MAG: hypothetical protein SF339_28185 [Blastocatellia bacterium]|nr:hypothetical protein [Blastocatellia bacterium]